MFPNPIWNESFRDDSNLLALSVRQANRSTCQLQQMAMLCIIKEFRAPRQWVMYPALSKKKKKGCQVSNLEHWLPLSNTDLIRKLFVWYLYLYNSAIISSIISPLKEHHSFRNISLKGEMICSVDHSVGCSNDVGCIRLGVGLVVR